MWRCADARAPGRWRAIGVAALLLAVLVQVAVLVQATALADAPEPGFWLKFGKSVRLCPGAREAVPEKLEGASWGIIASGMLSCQDTGRRYALKVDYLNVFIDPNDHGMLTQPILRFDWLGLALYRAAAPAGRDVDWLFDEVRPVKGELRRDASGRIVFGGLAFSVPKREAVTATNMLFYLTFGGALVAIDAR